MKPQLWGAASTLLPMAQARGLTGGAGLWKWGKGTPSQEEKKSCKLQLLPALLQLFPLKTHDHMAENLILEAQCNFPRET